MGIFSLEAKFVNKDGLETNVYSLEFDTQGKLSMNKVIGTACYNLFRWVDAVKGAGGSFKTTGGRFDLVMRSNSVVIDTAKAHHELRTKFFFNKTEESRTRFARRVLNCATFMASNPEVTDVNDLIKKSN